MADEKLDDEQRANGLRELQRTRDRVINVLTELRGVTCDIDEMRFFKTVRVLDGFEDNLDRAITNVVDVLSGLQLMVEKETDR